MTRQSVRFPISTNLLVSLNSYEEGMSNCVATHFAKHKEKNLQGLQP